MNAVRSTSFLALILQCIFSGCKNYRISYPPDTSDQVTIAQGVWGNVWFWERAFQPTEPTGTITPVECQVLIYEAIPLDSVSTAGGGFYGKIRTRLVGTTASNQTGFFQLSLPQGVHSSFVKEDTLYWQGTDDSIGIGGFKVLPGSLTKVQIDINYRAAY